MGDEVRAYGLGQPGGLAEPDGLGGALLDQLVAALCSPARVSRACERTGRVVGLRQRPSSASMAASIRSVLASRPVASAKRRACIGLMRAWARSAACRP